MTPDDLQQQLKNVCVEITHEARDARLTKSEVFEYLTVINSAAQISAGLTRRIAKVGLAEAQNDVFRFVAVVVKKILKIRRAVARRHQGPDNSGD